jgi:hypothetical protein
MPVFTPYTGCPLRSACRASAPALLHHVKQARPDTDGLTGGNCPDEPEIRVTGLGDLQSRHR